MTKLTRAQFIVKIAPYAILDMKKTNIPASLTIAQAILESADGNSKLTVEANNLFGIKGKGTIGSFKIITTEYRNGVPEKVYADFRMYNNWTESITDHSKLILNGVSWNPKLYSKVIGKRGIEAAQEIAKAGYATDPNYATKLIDLINKHNLMKYDNIDIDTNPVQIDYDTKIASLENSIKTLKDAHIKLAESLIEKSPPEWFVKEFPHALEVMSQKTGTNDFWRSVAVALRIQQYSPK